MQFPQFPQTDPKPEPHGQITLKPHDLSAVKELRVNARTEDGGSLRVENHSPADLPRGKYLLRIHLERAQLFAVTLK